MGLFLYQGQDASTIAKILRSTVMSDNDIDFVNRLPINKILLEASTDPWG